MTTKKKPADKVETKKTPVKKAISAGKKEPGDVNKSKLAIHFKALFPVVGIGASAGGLEAFESFFQAMTEPSGIAFVVIAHLSPGHASILPELIQKKTKMKVLQVVDNMKIEPNHVYIIPPNKEMAILNGTLQLLDFSKPRGVTLPIDTFLRSLAQDMSHRAIGIILSGTGTDGTLGVRAIKGEAGMVMAQDLQSAKYDGMPSSAINTGLVDYIVAPNQMPEKLLTYLGHQSKKTDGMISVEDYQSQTALQKIFVLLRTATDHDFSLYKRNTINRRIERRMHVHQIDEIDDYVRYLQESERETRILFKELLIGVTSFFRDPDAFELLKNQYIPALLVNKADDYQVRIWVPGCSSGEEAYSIAMIMHECMEIMGRHFSVQVFATDLDEDAINVARAGLYTESISADVTPIRLKRFFTKDENHFQIKKSVREMVVFAPQNLIKDPPFTKLDMISCRNLLIYFGPELQKKLLPIFHYSLKVGGILFLGSSETIGQTTDLFALLDKKWKLFRRHPSEKSTHPMLNFPGPVLAIDKLEKEPLESFAPVKVINTNKLLQAVLSQSDIPACVVVDDCANIIYIHGRTGRFLEPAEGETSINIIAMARSGLKSGLTNAIRKMASERQEIVIKGLHIKDGGGLDINLTIRPLPDFQTGHRGLMLIIFEEVVSLPNNHDKDMSLPEKQKKSGDVKRLEDELQYTKENLQTTIEELETSNEELKSTNEELQSTNEELQSTNEELETSKEELQSLNEESSTVNSELQSRIEELMAANDDIKNLLDATEIATIFLDIDLNIRRFTPKVNEFFHLTISDTGRPIEHFATTLKDIDLKSSAQKVLDELIPLDVDISDDQGKTYQMKIRPYRTLNNIIDGVVVTFRDTTSQHLMINEFIENEVKFGNLLESAPVSILIEISGIFTYINPAAVELFGASSRDAILGTPILDRVHPEHHDFVSQQIENVHQEKRPLAATKTTWLRLDGTEFKVEVSAIPTVLKEKSGALLFVWEQK